MNGCKESFNVQQSSNQRDANQGSLRGFLSTQGAIDLEQDDWPASNANQPPIDVSGLTRPPPALAQDHKASNKAFKNSSKQSNLTSFFQPGKSSTFLNDDDW